MLPETYEEDRTLRQGQALSSKGEIFMDMSIALVNGQDNGASTIQ